MLLVETWKVPSHWPTLGCSLSQSLRPAGRVGSVEPDHVDWGGGGPWRKTGESFIEGGGGDAGCWKDAHCHFHLSIQPSIPTFCETSLEQTSCLLGGPKFSSFSGPNVGCPRWRWQGCG